MQEIVTLVEKLLGDLRTAHENELRLVSQLHAANSLPLPERGYQPIRWVGEPDQQAKMLSEFALAAGEFGDVIKKATGMITKTDAFNYADLATINEAIIPALANHGLAILQPLTLTMDPDPDKSPKLSRITTILAGHGARLEVDTDVPTVNDIKTYGGNITYVRRYALQSLVEVAGEKDLDSSAERPQMRQQTAPSVNQGQRQERRQDPPPNRPPDTQLQRGNAAQGQTQQRTPQTVTSPTPAGDKQGTIAGLQGAIDKAQATTPATTPAASTPAPAAQAQSGVPSGLGGTDGHEYAVGPGPRTNPTPADEVIEYDSEEALKPFLKDLRDRLWARHPQGTEGFMRFCVDKVGKPFRMMDVVDGNKLLRALRAEDQRRASLSEQEAKALFEGPSA